MRESKVQKEIVDYLEEGGHYVIKTVRSNKVGIPDLIICTMDSGKFYAIEVKATGEKDDTSVPQEFHLDLIKKTGGKSFVADCLWDVIEEGL